MPHITETGFEMILKRKELPSEHLKRAKVLFCHYTNIEGENWQNDWLYRPLYLNWGFELLQLILHAIPQNQVANVLSRLESYYSIFKLSDHENVASYLADIRQALLELSSPESSVV